MKMMIHQDLLHNVMEHTQIMEQFENSEKNKDSCHSSILKNVSTR